MRMWRHRGRLALLACVAGVALQARAAAFGIPREVQEQLRARNCERVVIAVERWLAWKEPVGYLLAGWLSERGMCLKQNIDNAYANYEQAYRMGHPSAATRLAALAATREGGEDVVAVLWWGRRAESESPRLVSRWDCDPVRDRPNVDPDMFVDALKRWPAERLESCRALVGFNALMSADIRYPVTAMEDEVSGTVDLRFDLQSGTFQVTAAELDTEVLVSYVRSLAGDAIARLSRTRQPIQSVIQFNFKLE